MSKPGGKVSVGTHVGSGNAYADERQQKKYWQRHENAYRVREGFSFRASYSFPCKLTGKQLPSTSKYMPHQGKQEIARRLSKVR